MIVFCKCRLFSQNVTNPRMIVCTNREVHPSGAFNQIKNMKLQMRILVRLASVFSCQSRTKGLQWNIYRQLSSFVYVLFLCASAVLLPSNSWLLYHDMEWVLLSIFPISVFKCVQSSLVFGVTAWGIKCCFHRAVLLITEDLHGFGIHGLMQLPQQFAISLAPHAVSSVVSRGT